MAIEGFRALDFTTYHRDELPQLLAVGRGALSAKALGTLGSLAFRMPDGAAFTYQPSGKDLTLREGDAEAETVITLERESWEGLVHDY